MLHIKTQAKNAAARREIKKKSATARETDRKTKPSDRSVAPDYQQRSTVPSSIKGTPIPFNELIEDFDIVPLEI